MAPVTPPVWQQAGSYTARLDRQAAAALLTPHASGGPMVARSGVKPSGSNTSMQVVQRSTPDRWVTVGAGTCYIPATSTTGGSYVCHNDAAYDVQTTASHATLARKDLIIARVYDAVDDTGALNKFGIEVVTGTPAGSPSAPALPSQSITLAEVLIPAASTTVTNANITDRRQRVVALGGVLPCKNSGELPGSPYPGMKAWREDLTAEQVYDGSSWQSLPYGSWTSFTTTWTGSTSNPTKGNAVESSAYMQIGKIVFFRISIVLGSTTTIGTGAYGFSLPVAPTSAGTQACSGLVVDDSATARYACSGYLTNASGVFRLLYGTGGVGVSYNAPFTFANGDTIAISGSYEAA